MKKIILTCCIISRVIVATAQNNVTINNDNSLPDASSILDVKSTSKGLLIPRMNSSQRGAILTPAEGLMVYDTLTKSFWFKHAIGWTEMLNTTNNVWQTSSTNIFNGNAGNVGIGTNAPLIKLDVKTNQPHVARFNSLSNAMFISFYENDLYRGYVGNVGISNTSPASKLDVNGDLNVTGLLKTDGNAGTTGQVLVSNGASTSPTRQTASLSNSTRFNALIVVNTDPATPLTYSQLYNLNTTDVTISSSGITINRSGLYHFEGYLTNRITFGTMPTGPFITVNFFANGQGYDIVTSADLVRETNGPSFSYNRTDRFAQDLYIFAPATIGMSRSWSYSTGTFLSVSAVGKVTGYLISD